MDAPSVRRLRNHLGWSQARLATHAGVSQPLVSAWENGARSPRGLALRTLERLAQDIDVPTNVRPKRPRETMLEAALSVLAREGDVSLAEVGRESGYSRSGVEHYFPTRRDLARDMLREYRARMEAETERLYLEALRRREPRPRLWAYLEQGRHAPGSERGGSIHRAAFRAFLEADPAIAGEMGAWYERQVARVLDEAETDRERADAQLKVLAVDALWILDIVGLQGFTSAERHAVVDAAMRDRDGT